MGTYEKELIYIGRINPNGDKKMEWKHKIQVFTLRIM